MGEREVNVKYNGKTTAFPLILAMIVHASKFFETRESAPKEVS